MENWIAECFQRSLEVKRAALERLRAPIVAAAQLLVAAYQSDGKALFCGNGGSAADAQHLAAEFVGRYLRNRRALPALALHANSSALTAIGNDFGYDQVFARQVEAWAKPGDVLVGISTTGNSPSVVAAFAAARQRGVKTIALTGDQGGKLRESADVLLNVPSTETPRVQECHILIGHVLCEAVERALFPET